MKKLGIIQPGKIGDIIICLPIAKWYHDKGYEVIWPVDKNIINNFLGYIDYVTFIPINFDCRVAHQVCFNNLCNKVIDVSFTIPGANRFNSENYLNQKHYTFDEYKYFLADVPFEQKWNLTIKRDFEKEKQLYDILNINSNFIVVQEKSSDCERRVDLGESELLRVDIKPVSTSIFDWLGVLEKADKHVLIESCFSNLVDQLNISVKEHILLLKNGYYGKELEDGRLRGEPVLRLNWNKL